MLCPKCSMPTELDVQSVIDAAIMSDRFDDHGVPLPHRRHCLYRHDTWIGTMLPGTPVPKPCARHGRPYPCRTCGDQKAPETSMNPMHMDRHLRTMKWEAPCTCGCGETFLTNGRRRFFSDACRLRLSARETARARLRRTSRRATR